ncbi:DNA internalization-related competence protein ComEC/Rec2 [Lysinibacillus sp. G4S2]|uniref:DNA internalization-related competence protein ComEC/Rec2 n=1 Tax=Lysinibacillus sp. G4S2 TaxID=3055859 RepID=UPI0025A1222F|nr:DNA internalization-related competence protein ComEC/Rec2 [Lysinibacillus sp. G4S2]MDM5249391.1 DNA internalization-related competence protein ComEC/Rec2 [Lysinibacillus sp. G4S2]
MKGETRLISALVIVIGFLSYFFIVSFQLTEPSPLPSTFQITWSSEYKINGQKLRGFVKTETSEKLYVVYTFSSEQEKSFYENTSLTGRTYLVQGELIAPSPPAHAYAFSMEKYLISKGASGIFEVSSWTFKEEKKSIRSFLAKQRNFMKKHIETTFPKSLVAEAQALLIGLQDQVDHELQRAYQKLGITHLFAISGLHVALVSWLFFEGLLRVGIRKEIATLVLLIILPIYGVIAGGAPSVWRAVSVVELIMLMRYARWQISIDDALAISFICFVLLEPGVIYQIGFQLSYLATASLVYSGVIFKQSTNWLIRSFFITFVCQLLVYPLLLHHFYEISISSFLANIIFVPLFSFVILPMNIVLFVVTIISMPVAKVLFIGYEPLRVWLTKFILYIQELPFQLWSPGKPAIWLICVALISVLAGFYFLEKKHYGKFAVVIFIPALCIHLLPMLFNETKLTFLNVGQGDCIVIELPFRRAVYVIDSGGLLRMEQDLWKASDSLYEVGRQVVVPFLKGKGIRNIDIFIVTHAHADHMEGAEEVLQEINMHEIHLTPGSMDQPMMRDLLLEAKKHKVPVKEKMDGTTWRIGNTSFQYLWPRDTHYEGNDDSIVLYLQQGSFRALLTGDLEEHGERQLINLYNTQLAGMTLLKAGHHGSKTSSIEPFVELLQPELTIFSAGLNNRYRHPHDEVVERFTSRNLSTLTTGIDGTIEVRIRGNSWSVKKEKDLVQ